MGILRKTLIHASIGVLIVSTFMIGACDAAQQYFPSVSSENRYRISWQTRYLTTSISENKFNIYTTLVVNQTFAIPIWMDENMSPDKTGYTSIVNDTAVELVISYADYNATHLVRTRSFALKDRQIQYGEFGIFLFKNQTTYSYQQHAVLENKKYVQKTGFITNFNVLSVLDYINKEIQIGDAIYPGNFVINIGENILALSVFTGPVSSSNLTSLYDGTTGKLLSLASCGHSNAHISSGYMFETLTTTLVTTTPTVTPETSFLPEYAYWIICAGLGVLCVVLAGMLAKAKRT